MLYSLLILFLFSKTRPAAPMFSSDALVIVFLVEGTWITTPSSVLFPDSLPPQIPISYLRRNYNYTWM